MARAEAQACNCANNTLIIPPNMCIFNSLVKIHMVQTGVTSNGVLSQHLGGRGGRRARDRKIAANLKLA